MSFRMIRVAVFLTLLLATANGQAQFGHSKFGAGFLIGGSKIAGDIENTTTGFTLGPTLIYAPLPRLGLSVSGFLGQMSSGLDAIETDILNVNIATTLYALPNRVFNPFATVGLSLFRYSAKDGSGEPLTRADGSEISDWAKGVHLGGGAEIMAARPWALDFMLTYHFTGVDELDAISQGKNDGFFQGMVGLVHYFDFERTRSGPEPGFDHPMSQDAGPKPTATQETETEEASEGGIQFEPGSAKLREESKQQLDAFFVYLKNNPEEKIQLLGPPGKNSTHSDLTVARAEAVKAYLVKRGISPDRILISTE